MQSRLKPVAALLPLLFVTELHAQQTLQPLVVTATRFESGQQERPVAAQIITADEIRDSAATSVSEILSKLGGVHTRINFTGVPDSPIDLRGFGMTGDQNTLVLVNGLRLSENEGATARLSAIPIDSIERIEILRGSGAVLYGGGATGGTINIITRAPVGGGVSGSVSATIGSHDLGDLRAGVQTGGENWGLRLNAQHYETDNYRDNNRARQDAGSGELRFGGREDFVALGFNADKQESRLPGARTKAQLSSDRRGTSTPEDYLDSDSQLFYVRGEKRAGEVTLALDISQREKQAEMLNVWRSGADFDRTLSKTDASVTSVSPRLLWNSSFAGVANRLTVGLDWSDWSYDRQAFNNGSFFGFPYSGMRDETGKQNNRALYFRDEMQFATGTRLSIGVRREKIEQEQKEPTLQPKASVDRTLSAHELALQQELGNGFSAYGRIGRSFRVANIDENRCLFAPCAGLLKPQTSHDREVGMEWLAKGASFRAGLFQMNVDNEIHFNALTFTNMNLSPTRHRGLELEGRLAIWKTVDLAARYTRTEAEFREGTYNGVDVRGKDVPMVPTDRIGLNLGWQATANTRATLNVLYVGEQRYDNDQANRFRRMPSYTVADIKVSHTTGPWRFAVGINNLFDEKYYSYGIVDSAYTSFNAYPEGERNAYLSAEYRF